MTYTDPFTDDDPTWVPVTSAVTGPTFTVGTAPNTVTYTAPSGGSFRFGLFNERDPRLGGEVGNDVNRDGNPPGSAARSASCGMAARRSGSTPTRTAASPTRRR